MAEEIVDRGAELHRLTLRFDAPRVLTSGAVLMPVEDFAVLYRMSTGIYGRPGQQRFDQPFAYARPYVTKLHFGSQYSLEIIIPTLLIVGGLKGLPKLIPLVKQIIVEPGRTRRELKENKAARLKAEEDIIVREALLEDRSVVEQLARTKRDAEIYEAHARGLKSRAEIVETLRALGSEERERVIESYGESGLEKLYEIARRAEGGPTRAEDISITPVLNPEEFPTPPDARTMEPPRR